MFYDRDGPRNVRLDYERLFDLHFVLLLPSGHPLAAKKRIQPRDLAAYPLIVPPQGSFARRTIEQLFQRHNLSDQINIVMETPLLEIIRKYVAGGVGIGLVHQGGEPGPTPGVVVRPFEPKHESISVGMVSRNGAHLSGPVRDFQEIVRRRLGKSMKLLG
jgi:DNA-binding transcriptional LysR family regulator